MKETIDYEGEVYLCKKCGDELREGHNDWDSFFICDTCGTDDFIGKLKWIRATKQQITRIITRTDE